MKITDSKLHRMALVASVCGYVMLSAVGSAAATEKDAEKVRKSEEASAAAGEKKSAKSDASKVDRDAALKFAAEHHPELARLLEQLEKSRPNEFARATRELTQQIQGLERSREKNPARYQAQLEGWKQDSQIRVLMARWSHSNDPELEKQIRDLLRQRRESRSVQLQAEKVRLAEQQRKVDEQLAAMQQSIDTQVDQEWDQLSKKAGARKATSKKTSERPASAATEK